MQAADRFHRWQNLAEAVGKTVLPCLAAMAPAPGPDSREDPGAAASPAGPAPAEPDGFRDAHGHEGKLAARHRERYAAVQALRAGGCPIREIARRLELNRNTVLKSANAASIDEPLVKATSRPGILDPFKSYLGQRRNDGITSAAAPARGDPGPRLERRHPDRRAIPAPVPHRRRPRPRRSPARPRRREPGPAAGRQPRLAAAAGHVRGFAVMMTRRQGLLALEDRLTRVEAGDQPGLHSFARGIRRDQQAITAGLALPFSSSALEGKNCKIKYLKRLMYGPANFDLLRKMALLN